MRQISTASGYRPEVKMTTNGNELYTHENDFV